MKKQPIKPTRSKFNILRQVCNLIPPHLVSKIARVTGVEAKSRTFKPWSHVVTQCYAQLTHRVVSVHRSRAGICPTHREGTEALEALPATRRAAAGNRRPEWLSPVEPPRAQPVSGQPRRGVGRLQTRPARAA